MGNNYSKPGLATDIVFICGSGSNMKLLTITRKNNPFIGEQALPGGFVDQNETCHDAMLRELKEETNIDASNYTVIPLSMRSRPDRDPRGWVVSSPFLIYSKDELECVAGDDAATVEWALLKDIDMLAFDHGAIVCEALSKFWYQFPSFDSRLMGIVPYGMSERFLCASMDQLKERGTLLFGGSFNPWHEGHAYLLRNSQDMCYDEYLIVPDQNPDKPIRKGCAWNQYQNVLNSCVKALYDFMKPNVYPGFCGLEYGNHIASWYDKLLLPGSLSYLMGDDTFLSLTDWPNYDKIIKATRKFVVGMRKSDMCEVKDYASECGANIFYFQTNPFSNISSTSIREE